MQASEELSGSLCPDNGTSFVLGVCVSVATFPSGQVPVPFNCCTKGQKYSSWRLFLSSFLSAVEIWVLACCVVAKGTEGISMRAHDSVADGCTLTDQWLETC